MALRSCSLRHTLAQGSALNMDMHKAHDFGNLFVAVDTGKLLMLER
jgi:hypothetical protein